MWDGGYIRNASNLESRTIQRPHCRFASRTRAIYTHIQILHAKLSNDIGNPACGYLGRKRRAFSRPLESTIARRRPGKGITLPIRHIDNRIVK